MGQEWRRPPRPDPDKSHERHTRAANNTTQASGGTIVTHYSWDWNIRGPFDKIWTPETRPVLSPSRRMCVELPVAPADAITMSGTITFEEIGG